MSLETLLQAALFLEWQAQQQQQQRTPPPGKCAVYATMGTGGAARRSRCSVPQGGDNTWDDSMNRACHVILRLAANLP